MGRWLGNMLMLNRLIHTVQSPVNVKTDKFQALSSRFGMKSS